MTTTSMTICDGCREPIEEDQSLAGAMRANPMSLTDGNYQQFDFHRTRCLVAWLAAGNGDGLFRTTERIEAAIQSLHAADIPGLGDTTRNAVVEKLRASLGVYPTPPPGRPPVISNSSLNAKNAVAVNASGGGGVFAPPGPVSKRDRTLAEVDETLGRMAAETPFGSRRVPPADQR